MSQPMTTVAAMQKLWKGTAGSGLRSLPSGHLTRVANSREDQDLP
jgi:hypothetical protein